MWAVEFESKEIEQEINELIRSGIISSEDRIVITTWIRQIGLEGPESVQGDKRWDDHELYDEWKGYRSSCYSFRGRIIYKVKNKVIIIQIARITPDHNYKTKR